MTFTKRVVKVFILLLTSFIIVPHSYASSSTLELKTGTVVTDSLDNFDTISVPTISLNTKANLSQHFARLIASFQNKPKLPSAVLYNPQGKQLITQSLKDGLSQISIPKDQLTPGQYSLTIDNEPSATFTYGVLVMNLNQDTYQPKDTARIQLASLSSTGHTLCNSRLKLTINDAVIPTSTSDTCGADNVTDNPDYFASYNFKVPGNYEFSLTNLDTNNSISKTVIVSNTESLIIKRQGATRINPFKSTYTMTVTVTSPTNWSGIIEEHLPKNFQALSATSWQADLAKDIPSTFTYSYQAPKISPAIFELGPFTVGDHQESTRWSLASDATFQMQTGYFVGDGLDNRAITGIGFQPELLIIKDDTAGGTDGVIWKSSTMTSEVNAKLGDNEADISTDAIQSLDSNGFTLGTNADVNGANVRFTWVAFRGSDCTSSGTFCVGSYTGDGTASKSITSVGFQPDFVTIKASSGTNHGVFRTSSMGTNVGQIIGATNESTDGTRFQTLDSTGFTIGNNAQVNTNATTYWYFAFKNTTNAFAVGTYTGSGADNRAITGVGFSPKYLWVKSSNPTVAAAARFSLTESNGDYAGNFSDAVNTVDVIQSLDSDGFTVGTDVAVNENTKTVYWVAFGGTTSYSSSGIYQMATGSYSGNGTTQSVSSIGFTPDLVIIKHNDQATDQYAVFRTSLTKGDRTHYFANNSSSITLAITSLDATGFTVGSHATVNTSGDTYYWTAFGNAWDPETGTGAADFTIGAYTGNGIDNHDIYRLPFQPDLLAIKRDNGSSGGFRTSQMSGDNTGFYTASAETADWIQSISASSFQVGAAVQVNTGGAINHFFAFKTDNNFAVGSYTGTGSAQNITSPGFQPDLIWAKKASGGTARGAILRTSAQAGDAAQPFLNSPTATTHITGIISNGFSVGAGNLANENTFTYRYATWKINTAPSTPTLDSPADTATNQSLTPTLLTTSTDSSNDYLRYKIELCTNVGMTTGCQTFDQTSSQTGWSGQNAQTSTAYTSGTQGSYTIQSLLSTSTTYYWRSYAIDPGGVNTWSSTQTPKSFTTTSAPTAPTTPYAEGASNPSGILDLTPEFSAIHNDSDGDAAVYYQINVNTASDFTGTSMWDSGTTSMTSTSNTVRSPDISYAGTALGYNGTTYYWRIRFTDTKGAVGAWSTTQNFSTNAPPSTPALNSPADTSTGQSLTPTLLTTTTDPNSDYLRYKIELCTNVGMTTGCQTFDQTSSQTGWSGQNTQTSTAYTSGTQGSYTIQTPLANSTTYYWRSYAKDPGGSDTWSGTQPSVYSFTTLAATSSTDTTRINGNTKFFGGVRLY